MSSSRIPDRVRGVPGAVVPAIAASALALLLGACGGASDPTVETSTIELEPGAGAPLPPETGTDLVSGAGDTAADVVDGGADALADGADAAAAGANEAWTSLQADWADSVEGVQAHFGELSEEDVLATGGDRERLVAMVSERYNLEPDEAERQVADWEATL